ncbi:hypothetical protein H6G81_12905 [Scytonema hofmannii FACHB-248]|uniref:Uncharacterized protein n=2 Tax=Cyanophyceae TaxID=3028117 RepID=A0ABR8GQG7_9CYAN|nr:hypothetical protein [Scytonema hofmannii FACHB-248]
MISSDVFCFFTHLANRNKYTEARMINYKQSIPESNTELNDVSVDYTEAEEKQYPESQSYFLTDAEALNFGKVCIERLIKLKSKSIKKA